MTFALVASAIGEGDPAVSSAVNTTGAKLLTAQVTWLTSAGTPTITDSKANAWTFRRSQVNASASFSTGIWDCTAASSVGSGHTFTATLSGGFLNIQAGAWSEAGTVSFDQQAGTDSGTQPGSITPSADNALVLSATNQAQADSYAVDSGMTILFSDPDTAFTDGGGGSAYIIQTTAGAINPTWTPTGGFFGSSTYQVSYTASGGGGATDPAQPNVVAQGASQGNW